MDVTRFRPINSSSPHYLLRLDDCKGYSIMQYPNFFDAMFEMADMWWVEIFLSSCKRCCVVSHLFPMRRCSDVSATSYASLISGLLDDAKKKQDMFDK